MNIRSLLLAGLMVIGGSAYAADSADQTYKQEFAELKKSPDFENLFDEDLNQISHEFERKIQIYKAVPNKWQRFTCGIFLSQDAIAITPEMMPELYAFIENLAQKSGIPTPTIFISLREKVFNAFAAKLLNGNGGILIEQKLLNELNDKQLEAVVAHEIGHIKHNHVNKMVGLSLATIAASGYGLYKWFTYNRDNKKLSSSEFTQCAIGAQVISALTQILVIGKKFEKQADRFACEAGHAEGIIELMKAFEAKDIKADAELLITNDKLIAEQANLSPEDFTELQQGLSWTNALRRFGKWLHEKTPFESHPSHADRAADAQAYLDAQAPAIEKA